MNILLICPRSYVSYYSLFELYFGKGTRVTSPPLGLLTVAGLLPPEWTLRLVDENLRDVTPEDFAFADSVFIGAMLPQRDYALALVREAKLHGKHVVVGGPYASSLPEELLAAGCDVLVRGEAEQVIGQVIEAVETRRQGVVIAAETRPDLRHTPVPRYELLNMRQYVVMAVQTTRGCPHNCEFCDVVNLNGRIPRHKNPEQVINELAELYRLGWRGMVFICDDNFIGSREYARELLRHIIAWSKSHGEPFVFTVQASIELARDKELIDLMTEANISEVFVGVETPDENVLKRNNKNHNVKNPLAESLRFINANGLSLQCSFIVGFDGEQAGAGEKIVAFAQAVGLPQVVLNILVAFPGTTLCKRLEKSVRLRQPWLSQDCFYGLETNVVLERPQQQVGREFVDAMLALYNPENYLDRVFDSIMRMRPTRAALAKAMNEPLPKTAQPAAVQKREWYELRMFASLLWRHGVLAPYRLKFWRQFITVRRKNPSRFLRYIVLCLRGDMVAKFTRKMQNRARELELAAPRA